MMESFAKQACELIWARAGEVMTAKVAVICSIRPIEKAYVTGPSFADYPHLRINFPMLNLGCSDRGRSDGGHTSHQCEGRLANRENLRAVRLLALGQLKRPNEVRDGSRSIGGESSEAVMTFRRNRSDHPKA